MYLVPSQCLSSKFWLLSSKVMNENTPNEIPVCLYECLRGFREKLLTIHVKTAEEIIMKFHIWIRYLLTYVYSYITFWYLTPKWGLGGALMEIIKKLLNCTANFVMSKVVGDGITDNFCLKKIPPKREGGWKNVNSSPWSKLNQILYT